MDERQEVSSLDQLETEAERQERFWRNRISPERRKRIDALKARGTVRYDSRIERREKGDGR